MIRLRSIASIALGGIILFQLMHVDTESDEAYSVIESSAIENVIVGESVLAVNTSALAYTEMR